MTPIRSRRWTVEVGPLEDRYFKSEQVECVWIDYWQPAGMRGITVESVSLWHKPYGEEIAQILGLEVRGCPDWVQELIKEHLPAVES